MASRSGRYRLVPIPPLEGQFVDQLGYRKSLGDIAGQLARARKMPNEQRKNLVGIDESAVAIDGPNTITVAVGGEARVVFSGAHRLAERFNVRFDGFGVHAAEKRVARAADFAARDAVPSEELVEQARGGAVHGVADKTQLRIAQARPVHQFFDCVEIRHARIERLNQAFPRREGRHAAM